jgi:hypothetical protein
VKSDAARIRRSYRYRNYGVTVSPAFAKQESARYRRGRESSPSVASSSSSSRQRPSRALVVKMDKATEWKRIADKKSSVFIDLGSDRE